MQEKIKNLNPAMAVFLVAATVEAYLAIPFLGGLTVLSSFGTILIGTLILHIIAYKFAQDEGMANVAPITGIITSILAWIPVLGWMLHLLTFAVYLYYILKGKYGLLRDTPQNGVTSSTSRSTQHNSVVTVNENHQDDLTKIEGIGPKIDELLKSHSIKSYAKLAAVNIEDIKAILESNSLGSHDPTTWPEQAILARDGKWKELKTWQDILDGGVEPSK